MKSRASQGALRLIAILVVGVVIGAVPALYLYGQNGTMGAQVTSNESQISALEGQLETQATSVSSLNARLAANAATVSALKAALARNLTEILSLDNQLSTLETELGANISELASIQGRIASLEGAVNSDNSTITSLNSQLTALSNLRTILQGQVDELGAQVLNLTSIVGLGQFTHWLNITLVFTGGEGLANAQQVSLPAPSYAGYFRAELVSNSSINFLGASWNAYGINYSQLWTLGSMGDVFFPVMPSPDNLTLVVGTAGNAVVSVSVDYYY